MVKQSIRSASTIFLLSILMLLESSILFPLERSTFEDDPFSGWFKMSMTLLDDLQIKVIRLSNAGSSKYLAIITTPELDEKLKLCAIFDVFSTSNQTCQSTSRD